MNDQSPFQERNYIAWAETTVIGLIIFMYSGGLLPRLMASGDNPEGSALLRFLFLPTYVFIFLGLIPQWRNVLAVLKRSPFMIALMVIIFLSTTWSVMPDVTLRRGIAIVGTTLLGLYLAVRFSWRDMLRLLGVVFFALAVCCVIAAVVFPGFGVDHEIHVGAWKGIWWEKNQMGGYMVRGAFMFAFLLMADAQWRRFWAAALFLAVALVLMSTSKTSLLGLMLGIGILVAYGWMRRGPVSTLSIIWVSVAVAGGLISAVILAPEVLVAIIGRDLTLTGRTDIWISLTRAIEARFWLGYGYGAFWIDPMGPAYWIRLETEWPVPTAHNGILEIWLSVGLLGVLVFVADFMLGMARSLVQAVYRFSGVFAFGIFALLMLFSISESVFLNPNALTWVFYSMIVSKLALNAHERAIGKRGRTF